jgi:hypothetical protein
MTWSGALGLAVLVLFELSWPNKVNVALWTRRLAAP